MGRIAFFEPARLASGYEEFYTHKGPRRDETCKLGNYLFWLVEVKLVNGIIGGVYDLIGYEKIYESIFISQEETDVLFKQYIKETGQEHERQIQEKKEEKEDV